MLSRLGPSVTLFLVLTLPSTAFSIWKPTSITQTSQKFVVTRIQAPCLEMDDAMNDLRFSIDKNGLHYDCSAVINGTSYYGDSSFYYLASLKEDSRIIGKMEVWPDWERKDVWKNGKKVVRRVLCGLKLDGVKTAKSYRRMGVGTAILKAIERDACELMELMETRLVRPNREYDTKRRDDRAIQLRLIPAYTKEALAFYQSVGFQWEPLSEESDPGKSSLKKLVMRLKLFWKYFVQGDLYYYHTENSDLVKLVEPSPTITS